LEFRKGEGKKKQEASVCTTQGKTVFLGLEKKMLRGFG